MHIFGNDMSGSRNGTLAPGVTAGVNKIERKNSGGIRCPKKSWDHP